MPVLTIFQEEITAINDAKRNLDHVTFALTLREDKLRAEGILSKEDEEECLSLRELAVECLLFSIHKLGVTLRLGEILNTEITNKIKGV